MKNLPTVAAVLLLGVSLQSASASMIVGTNPVLDGRKSQYLYIPIQAADSGVLGTQLKGKFKVGLDSDRVRLKSGQDATGEVSFLLNFGVSGAFDRDTVDLIINVTDLDFLNEVVGGANHREWVDLTVVIDPGNVGNVDLTLNQSNYGLFRLDGFGKTDNTKVTYTLNLMKDLGVTSAQFDAMEADGGFGVMATLHSDLDRFGKGSCTYYKTPDKFQVEFSSTPIPEPVSMGILAAGIPMMLLRRRRSA